MHLLVKLWSDEDGNSTVEYALLLYLIAVIAILAWSEVGHSVRDTAHRVAEFLHLDAISTAAR